MAIQVSCKECRAKFKVDAQHAGKTAKCPRCQHRLEIPKESSVNRVGQVATNVIPQKVTAAAPNPASDDPQKLNREDLSQTLLNAFQGPIKRSSPTIIYRLSALLVALIMVSLPIIYIAFIGLVGYGVYYHAVNNTSMLEVNVGSRGKLMVLLAYLAPMVCGAIGIVFMFKPLFARGASHTRTRSLTREREPVLFSFVDRICETVGSPRPKRIDLDCQVNASAMFRRGFLSMFGRDLVLTIGMPLIAGLNTRQFAGVLAHEFGHFSQGTGMRLSFVIRRISSWFARVVYQRDAADEWLATTAQSLDIRFSWILYLASAFVWVTRRILWVFMQAGNFVGSHLMRQMEFDADRYEIRLAGSEAFVQTARRLQHLNVAMDAAFSDLREFYREGRLGDDLPQLVSSRVQQLPPKLVEAIDAGIESSTTSWLDTHPSDKERIDQAKRENSPGVFLLELPAASLLSDFTAQSKATTWEYYRQLFGEKLDQSTLRPISELLAKNEQHQAARVGLDRFFVGGWSIAEPFYLDPHTSSPPADPQAAMKELAQLRSQMQEMAAATEPRFEQLSKGLGESMTAKQLQQCLRAGMKVNYNDKRLAARDEGQIKLMREKAAKQISVARNQIAEYQRIAAKRLSLSLQLFCIPKVAQRIPRGAELAKTFKPRFECFRILSDQMPTIVQIVEQSQAFNMLVQQLLANNQDDQVGTAVQTLMRELFPIVQRVRSAFQNFKYPYDHTDRNMSLSNFLVPEVPVKDDLASLYHAANQLVESAPTFYERLLGDMVLIASAVETAVGLVKPLPSVEMQKSASA